MGEYLRNAQGKQTIKLGTCESMYYVRRSEMERFASVGPWDSELPRDILRAGSGIFYRFRWPWEDAHEYDQAHIGQREPFMSHTVYFGNGNMPDVDHDTATVHVKPRHGLAGGFNVFLPCPLGKDWIKQGLTTGGAPSSCIQINSEKFDADGKAYTVFECPYCGHMWHFGPDDEDKAAVDAIKAEIRAVAEREKDRLRSNTLVKIAERISNRRGELTT